MSAESGLEVELEAGLECDDFTLAHPVLRRRHSEPQLAHHPSASGWDLSMPSLHAGTEFLNKDSLWVIAVWKQYQESEERTGLTIPGLHTAMIIVTLTEWLTIGATSVLHKDQKAEQSSTSHPAAAASKLCRCGTTVTTEVPTVLLGVEAALDTSKAGTPLVHST